MRRRGWQRGVVVCLGLALGIVLANYLIYMPVTQRRAGVTTPTVGAVEPTAIP